MPFQKGNRANPNGRPPGRPDRRARFRQMFEDEAPDVVRAVIDAAKGGDMLAAKLCLERFAPPLRPEAARRPIKLDGATVEHQGRSVLAALNAGTLAPDEAALLLRSLAEQAQTEKIGLLADCVAKLMADRGLPLPAELEVRRRIPATLNQGTS